MNYIKVLMEMIEREAKLQTESITTVKKEYHQENIDTLSHTIHCCEIVEKLPSVQEIYNYLPSVGIGTVKTAQAIYDRIKEPK